MSDVIIFDIKRFAVHDGPGIRTTLFLKGCPLRCWWCHNPESQSGEPFTVDVDRKLDGRTIPAKKRYGKEMNRGDLMDIILRDRHFFEESEGGVTFSGGEPMMQFDGLKDLLRECKRNGLHTTLDTSGFAGQALFEEILDDTDLFLYDLKNMDPELHRTYTGVDNGLILSNADFLLEHGANVIFRIPVVPGINTSSAELDRFYGFIEKRSALIKEVHLLPYHRIAANKYSRLGMKNQVSELNEPEPVFLENLRKRFEKAGPVVVIGG